MLSRALCNDVAPVCLGNRIPLAGRTWRPLSLFRLPRCGCLRGVQAPGYGQNLQCPSALEDRGDGCGLPSTGLAGQGALAALPLTVHFYTCWACSVQGLGSCERQRICLVARAPLLPGSARLSL